MLSLTFLKNIVEVNLSFRLTQKDVRRVEIRKICNESMYNVPNKSRHVVFRSRRNFFSKHKSV